MRVVIKNSPRPTKKLTATFFDDDGTLVKTVHFGGAGYKDFIQYSKTDPALAKRKRLAYLKRHRARESWRDPMTPGSLSRWILWEKTSMPAALKKYKVLFGLK